MPPRPRSDEAARSERTTATTTRTPTPEGAVTVESRRRPPREATGSQVASESSRRSILESAAHPTRSGAGGNGNTTSPRVVLRVVDTEVTFWPVVSEYWLVQKTRRAADLLAFGEELETSGLLAALIEQHDTRGLTIAR